MKRFRAARIIISVLIVGIAAPSAYLATLDPNDYRDELQRVVERATGRHIELGWIELEVSARPRLVIHDFAMNNVSWSEQPLMLTVGRVEARVDLLALLSRRLEVHRFALSDADLRLERKSDGASNWAFLSAGTGKGQSGLWGFFPELRNVSVDHSALHLADAAGNAGGTLEIRRLTLSRRSDAPRMKVAFEGAAAGKDLRVDGETGFAADLLLGARGWPLDVEVRTLGLRGRVTGELGTGQEAENVDLRLDISAASLDQVVAATGAPLPRGLSLALTMNLNGGMKQARLHDVALRLGTSELAGGASVARPGGRLLVEGNVHGKRIDLDQLEAALPNARNDVPGARSAPSARGARLIRMLRAVDGRVALRIDELIGFPVKVRDVEGTLSVASGQVDLRPLRFEVVGNVVEAELDIDAQGDGSNFRLAATAEDFALDAPAARALALEGIRGRADVRLDVAGPMHSPGELVGEVASALSSLRGESISSETARSDPAASLDLGLQNLTLTVDDFPPIEGDIRLGLAAGRPRIEGRLVMERLDHLPGPGRSRGKNDGVESPLTLFSDAPLPTDWLDRVDGRLDLEIGHTAIKGLPVADVRLGLRLEAGRLDVDPVRATVAGSDLQGIVTIDATRQTPALTLSLKAPRLSVKPLLGTMTGAELVEGRADLVAELSGQGASLAALMKTLHGETKLLIGRGRVKTRGMDLLVGGLTALVTGTPAGEDDWVGLNCLAADFRIRKGVATQRTLLADTEHATLVGAGRIDLGNERLDLKVTPRPKTTTLNMAVPIDVGGTFRRPTFTPDTASVARRVGGLVGAVLFPPAILAAFADLGTDDDHPCRKLATGRGGGGAIASSPPTSGRDDGRASNGETGSGRDSESFRSVVRGFGKRITGLFSDQQDD